MSESAPPYPNRVREFRVAAFLSREALHERTSVLEQEDKASYAAISARTLERLERGETRPRIRTAAAIAKVLGISPTELFPLGPDDGLRNPQGHTTIPSSRPPRGKRKK